MLISYHTIVFITGFEYGYRVFVKFRNINIYSNVLFFKFYSTFSTKIIFVKGFCWTATRPSFAERSSRGISSILALRLEFEKV